MNSLNHNAAQADTLNHGASQLQQFAHAADSESVAAELAAAPKHYWVTNTDADTGAALTH